MASKQADFREEITAKIITALESGIAHGNSHGTERKPHRTAWQSISAAG